MSMVVNPYRFGGGGPVLQPAYFTAEALSGVAGGAGPVDICTLSLSGAQQQANEKYLGIWTTQTVDSDGSVSTVQCRKDDTTVLGRGLVIPVNTANGIQQAGGFFIHDAGATPVAVDFQIEAGTESSSTVSNSRLSLLKLGASDTYTESLSAQSTSSTSAVVAATHNFTPGSTGDYTILVSFDLTSTATHALVSVTDGTTSTGDIRIANRPTSGTCVQNVVLVLPLAAVSGSKTITVNYWTALSSVTISNIRIIAIRNDRFANVYSTRLGSANSGTDTSYTTGLSQTFTPAAGDHLTIMATPFNNSSTSLAVGMGMLDDATLLNETASPFGNTGANRGGFGFGHCIASYPASSRTQAIQRKSQTASATATIRAGAAIACFSLIGLT